MNIYVDESGVFVSENAPVGSWNAVAALTIIEPTRKKLEHILADTKRSKGLALSDELRLKDFSEEEYFRFLHRIAQLDVSVFAVATDSGVNTPDVVRSHQKNQAATIVEHMDKMIHEDGKTSLLELSEKVAHLSPQLYVQLICQLELLYEVLDRSINYYAQRHPPTLSEFRWRVDQKNLDTNSFEEVYKTMLPPILQTKTLEKPFAKIEGFDYSRMRQYEFGPGEYPTYFKDTFGIETSGIGLNIGKIIHSNFQFVSSHGSMGVQVTDLIVSGLRRCLRLGFTDNEKAAHYLGRLMVRGRIGEFAISLIALTESNEQTSLECGNLVRLMTFAAKPMLLSE